MRSDILRSGAVLAAAGLGTALAAACSTAPAPSRAAMAGGPRQCFLASQVNGFHPVDAHTVHVHVGASDVYELDIVGFCPNVRWENRIGIRSTGGGSWVCRGLDAELLVPSQFGTSGVDRCLVRAVRQLTEEQARAIRRAR